MTVRIGSSTFWFFLMVLADRPSQPVGQPVAGGLAYRVVGVAGLRDDALIEVAVQFPELVDYGGLGGAADLAPLPLAARGSRRDLAAPQPGAVPVAFRVAAGAAVFERDSVFSAPAPGCHGDKVAQEPGWGLAVVTTARH